MSLLQVYVDLQSVYKSIKLPKYNYNLTTYR